MKTVLQPHGSKMCGQACVAMAAGLSLPEAIHRMDKHRATGFTDIRKALILSGLTVGAKTERVKYHGKRAQNIPKRAIAKLRHKDKTNAHFVLWWDGKMYDPEEYLPYAKRRNWYATSFLRILRPPRGKQ